MCDHSSLNVFSGTLHHKQYTIQGFLRVLVLRSDIITLLRRKHLLEGRGGPKNESVVGARNINFSIASASCGIDLDRNVFNFPRKQLREPFVNNNLRYVYNIYINVYIYTYIYVYGI